MKIGIYVYYFGLDCNFYNELSDAAIEKIASFENREYLVEFNGKFKDLEYACERDMRDTWLEEDLENKLVEDITLQLNSYLGREDWYIEDISWDFMTDRLRRKLKLQKISKSYAE
jgi:hypothetical protein